MSSFCLSSQLSKTIQVIVAKLLLLFAVLFCVKQDFGVGSFGSDQWVRLCTLTSNGSSLMNVTMPCGVHVKSDESKDDPKNKTDVSESWREVDDSPEYVKITLDDDRNTKATTKSPNSMTTKQDSNPNIKHSGNKISEGDLEEEVDIEEGGDVQEEGSDVQEEGSDVHEEGDADVIVEDDNDDRDIEIDSVDNDEDQSTYDKEALNVGVNESVSEEKEDDISYVRDQLKNQRRPNAVSKVMLGYLLNARSQLYEKINYLLNLLQRTFFNRKLNCRRRRNSIELPSLLNNNRKQENKKNPSLSSVILEPTFERSMMTMSFLMFGVFVIQVIQKLKLLNYDKSKPESENVTSKSNHAKPICKPSNKERKLPFKKKIETYTVFGSGLGGVIDTNKYKRTFIKGSPNDYLLLGLFDDFFDQRKDVKQNMK